MSTTDTASALLDVQRRLAALEDAVFGGINEGANLRGAGTTDYSGPAGAVLFLIKQQFFDQRRPLGQVREEATNHGYVYSGQAFSMALMRLSQKDGPLVVIKEGGRKLYARRK